MRLKLQARSELYDIIRWYDKKHQGLGQEFLLCVEDSIAKIQRNPKAYSEMDPGVRRILIRRFPYGIYYIIGRDGIVILSIWGTRQKPKRSSPD